MASFERPYPLAKRSPQTREPQIRFRSYLHGIAHDVLQIGTILRVKAQALHSLKAKWSSG